MKLTISTNTAKVLAKALPLALEPPNSARHHLTYVHISEIDGVLTFTTTNGYIALRIGVDSHGDRPTDPITVQGKEFCKALGNIAKSAGKGSPTITLESWYDGVTVSNATDSEKVLSSDVHFPPMDSVLNPTADNESGVLLNGQFLADIAKAATLCAGDSGLVTVETLNTRKAGKITADSQGIQFVGVIMPCRQESKVGQ